MIDLARQKQVPLRTPRRCVDTSVLSATLCPSSLVVSCLVSAYLPLLLFGASVSPLARKALLLRQQALWQGAALCYPEEDRSDKGALMSFFLASPFCRRDVENRSV